jgi:hypothetical protein
MGGIGFKRTERALFLGIIDIKNGVMDHWRAEIKKGLSG